MATRETDVVLPARNHSLGTLAVQSHVDCCGLSTTDLLKADKYFLMF